MSKLRVKDSKNYNLLIAQLGFQLQGSYSFSYTAPWLPIAESVGQLADNFALLWIIIVA
jgi:hypothetical protein